MSTNNYEPDGQCLIPQMYQGDWFSLQRGEDLDTLIDSTHLRSKAAREEYGFEFNGQCHERRDDNTTVDADGNHDSRILFYDRFVQLSLLQVL